MKKLLPLLLALVVTAALAQSSTGINGGGPNTLPGAGPANEVLATPAGAAGSVSLRALTSADLPALTSTQVVQSFTGTCNSTTFLAGNGTCTAPIITAKVTSNVVCASNTGVCVVMSFTGLSTGTIYGLNCFLETTTGAGSGQVGLQLANGSGFQQQTDIATATVTGNAAVVGSGANMLGIPNTSAGVEINAFVNLNIGNFSVDIANTAGTGASSTTVFAGSWCTLVKP